MSHLAEPIEKSDEILQGIRHLLVDDLRAVDLFIKNELHSTVPLTETIVEHIFKSGGKRLRPLMVILAAKAACPDVSIGTSHHALAAVIEFVHTATLLHDDVVDNSTLRRGKKTANAIWNNQASILVGDFLYARAFQILSREQQPQILSVLAKTTNAIAEGELRQLMNQHDTDLSIENYYRVITEKTAQLFSAAAEIGVILSGGSAEVQNAMQVYGLQLGIAFQIIDDLLDYSDANPKLGKHIGDDLAEGKVTLPIIFAIQSAEENERHYLQNVFKTGELKALDKIILLLEKTNALEKTANVAIQAMNKGLSALNCIQQSPFKNALIELGKFSIKRTY